MFSELACHTCTGAMLSSLYCPSFSICVAEASTHKCFLGYMVISTELMVTRFYSGDVGSMACISFGNTY